MSFVRKEMNRFQKSIFITHFSLFVAKICMFFFSYYVNRSSKGVFLSNLQDNRFINGIRMKIRQMKVPEVYQPILIVMLMSVIQQFSGMSILRAYVVKIFDNIFDEDAASNEGPTNHTQIRSNRLSVILSYSLFFSPSISISLSHRIIIILTFAHTLSTLSFSFKQKQTLFLFSFLKIHNLFIIFSYVHMHESEPLLFPLSTHILSTLSRKNMLYTLSLSLSLSLPTINTDYN
jgi:hypothetical protein